MTPEQEYLGSLTSEEIYSLHPEIVKEQLTPNNETNER